MKAQFTPVADSALLVTFGDAVSDTIFSSILALDKAITQSEPAGVIEVVPALVNVLVSFDPLVTDHDELQITLQGLLDTLGHGEMPTTRRTVQVCYDHPYSPDLAAVAKACDLDEEAVIAAHLSGNYKVLMYGFAPGYAYMGGVPNDIQVPRKPAPVRDIPAGSVLIAGPQCLVTTLKMPTGWSIIGRSPTQVLSNDPSRPFLFDVGDQVNFERIDRNTLESSLGEANDE